MLNPNAQQWLYALRSGDYAQGFGALKRLNNDNPEFCCLGVACDLYLKAVGGSWVAENFSSQNKVKTIRFITIEGVQCQGDLPEVVANWLGLVHANGKSDKYDPLTVLNDSKLLTFTQIADFIESEPDGLFT